MKVYFIYYTDSAYIEFTSKSVVLADDFHTALNKWSQRFIDKPNAKIQRIELFWEFPIL